MTGRNIGRDIGDDYNLNKKHGKTVQCAEIFDEDWPALAQAVKRMCPPGRLSDIPFVLGEAIRRLNESPTDPRGS